MRSVMRYTGLSARERDAAIRGVPVPARLADGAGRGSPHSPNCVSRPARRQDPFDRGPRRSLPGCRPGRLLAAGGRRADLRARGRRLRPPQRRGIAVSSSLGRGPGDGMVGAPAFLHGRAAAAAFHGGSRRSRWFARPLVRAVPDGRVDAAVGAAGGLPRQSVPFVPADHRRCHRLADRLHRARLAAGQVIAGRPGVRSPAGARRSARGAACRNGNAAAA